MGKLSKEEIDRKLAEINSGVNDLNQRSLEISEKLKQSTSPDWMSQLQSPSISSMEQENIAKKVLKTLFEEPKWNYRKYDTIKRNLPGMEDKKIKEILRGAGSVKSSIQDIHGNELWKRPSPDKLSSL